MIRKQIPNFVTILNLLSGCISIVFAFGGNLALASWFIGFAAVFDFLDGMLARWLEAKSPTGGQLDSLADVISFGLAPAFVMYHLMLKSYNIPFLYFNDKNVYAFLAFLIPAFSALRLAKFNLDENQSDSFRGLPTPANALFFASLPLVILQSDKAGPETISNLLKNFWLLLGFTVAFSLLMVSNIRLFSLKVKRIAFGENRFRYILLVLAAVMFVAVKWYALPLVVILYILLSLLENIRNA